MTPRQLLRLSAAARRPGSMARVRLILAVCAICAVIVGIERLVGGSGNGAPGRSADHGASQPITN